MSLNFHPPKKMSANVLQSSTPQALFLHGLLEGMARIEVPNLIRYMLGIGGEGTTNLL